jgi:hypothetical protein
MEVRVKEGGGWWKTYNKIILLKAFLNHQAPQVHVL